MFWSDVCPDRSPFRVSGEGTRGFWAIPNRQHIPVSTSTGPLCHHGQSGLPDGGHSLRYPGTSAHPCRDDRRLRIAIRGPRRRGSLSSGSKTRAPRRSHPETLVRLQSVSESAKGDTLPPPGSVGCTAVPPHEPGSQLHREEGRRLFGLDPAGYRAGRPDYPDVIYETLVERCGLGPTTRALEIGPGTGLATQRLLRDGAHVTAIEPDPGMASYLRDAAASPNLDVVISSFEEADIPLASFDLAVAATSFHWIDQKVGLSKLGHVIRSGGWVALWWTLFRDPDQPDEFSQAVEQILGPATRGAFDEPGRPPFQLDELHRRRDMTRWAGLDVVASQVTSWTCSSHLSRPERCTHRWPPSSAVRPTNSAGFSMAWNDSPRKCPRAS